VVRSPLANACVLRRCGGGYGPWICHTMSG
jgi:hypothetical protein